MLIDILPLNANKYYP